MPKILKFEKLESTNTLMKELIQKDGSNFQSTVIISKSQTLGRGRRGRTFSSPEGGLYISMTFQEDEFKYPTATAAVYTMLALKTLKKSVKIKWLNDLYYNNKKVCGILAEKVGHIIIIGIGINLTTRIEEFPLEIQNKAGSLFPGKIEKLPALRDKLTKELIETFYIEKPQDLLSLYRENCFTLNTEVTVNNFKTTYTAKAIGINDNFELLIEKDNIIRPLSTGEIILNPLQVDFS